MPMSKPDNRVIPLHPHPQPWEERERAARYAGFDRLALDDGPMVERARRRRRQYRRAALIGAVIGALLWGGSIWYRVHGAEVIAGHAIVVDGDTIRVGETRVRLWGIDAPEKGQKCSFKLTAHPWPNTTTHEYDCGAGATTALRYMLARDPSVTCQAKAIDRFGRTVAVCWNGEGNIGARMVAAGHAVDVPRYSGGAYRDHEAAAKAERLGVWAGTFVPPEEYRRSKR